MAFMVPVYTDEPFVCMTNEHGESIHVPADVANLQDGYLVETEYKGKWFCRLSAPGYMDCTEWDGPFDSMDEAQNHIINTFDVDAITGDDFEDEGAL